MKWEELEGNGPEYSFEFIQRADADALNGKRLFVLGSSVALGSASCGRSIGEYLAARYGMILTKSAVSGTTLSDLKPGSYTERLDEVMPELQADLFICQLSTNDARLGAPLGTPGEGPGRTTVCGAIEYIAFKAKELGCPLFFFTGSRYDSPAYGEMVRTLYVLSEKLGFGVLDLWSDDAFNDIPDEKRKLWMKDGVHPTAAGYRDWWCPELERQLLLKLNAGK